MIVKKIPSEYELDNEENGKHRFSFKVKPPFQIMYYHGRHKIQTHAMNVRKVYEKCKSRELIIVFNKRCMCIS